MADLSAYRSLRIGFAERDAAVKELGDHYAAGRLELAEFEERMERANVARTQAELDALFTDLPRPHHRASRQPAERRGRHPYPAYPPYMIVARLLPLVLFAIFLTAILARAGPWIFFPLVWLWFGFGARRWTHTRG